MNLVQVQVLQHQKLDRAVKTASVWQVRQPIYTSSKAKWRRYQKHLGPFNKALAAFNDSAASLAQRTSHGYQEEEGFFAKAEKLHQAGQLDQARKLYEQILQGNSSHAAARYLLGCLLHQQGHSADALSLLHEVGKHYLHFAPFHYNIGCTYVALGRMAEAVASFEEALRLHPEYPEAAKLLQMIAEGAKPGDDPLEKTSRHGPGLS